MQFFEGFPLWANIAVFAVGVVIVWRAGTRLSNAADAIAERTGWGHAFVGALLLGGATSLPEIGATTSASLLGNAPMAVNNIFGGIAMQVAILAIADAFAGRPALTSRSRHPGLLLEGVLLVLVLSAAAVAIAVGDRGMIGVGVWSTTLLALVVLSLFLVKQYEATPQWKPAAEELRDEEPDATARREPMEGASNRRVVMQMILASVVVLIGGFAVAKAGEQIAEQTGIGGSFVGAALMPLATSMPELSTTIAAVKIGAPVMAISNIFGTNLFDSSIIFIIDATYAGPPVLNEVGRFAQVGALLGMICTMVYLAGIIWRRERTFLRLGIDSIVVVVLYLGGIALLYTLR